MQIGCQQFCIDPPFPVNRMLREEKHQAVSGHLYCRIAALYPENDLPFYHVSIDTVELWKDREDRITQVITEALGRDIHCICSSTHSHNCPCMTTDDAYVDYVLDVIRQGVAEIPLHTYREVQYQYQYRYFDKVGKSRVMDYVTPHLYAETLSLYGDGRRVLTFLMHNIHPTTKELWVGDFTAEYPGYCIEQLRQEYPGEFFTCPLGPAGDTSPHFVRKDRSYEEMIRLAELLRQEFDAQLKTQCPEARKPVHLRFEHTTFPKDLVPVERSRVEIPARPNADEQKVLARLDGTAPQHPRRELRPFERVDEYHVSHLIFSKEYSIIFEPFELYSEYYGAVNKSRCSIATISNGFEHYLTGWYLRRLSIHGSLNGFSDRMRRQLWEILGRWSCQEALLWEDHEA